MTARMGAMAAIVLLGMLALATPASAATSSSVDVEIQAPGDGTTLSGEVTLSWDVASDLPIGAGGQYRVDAWDCDGWDRIADGDLGAAGSSSTTIDTTALSDCDDAQLKVSVQVDDVAESDSISVKIDNQQADLDLAVVSTTPAGGASEDASVTLEWTNADPNAVPTELLAVDASTGATLWTDTGQEDEGRTVVTLPAGSAMLEVARDGDLEFRVCTDAPTVEEICASQIPVLDRMRIASPVEVDVTFDTLPSGQCADPATVAGTAQASTEVGGDQGATVQEVQVRLAGASTTEWAKAELDGDAWSWSTECPGFGSYHAQVRVKATVPDPNSQSQWYGPFTKAFDLLDDHPENAVVDITDVDASACESSADNQVNVQGTVTSPNVVDTVSISVRDGDGDQLFSPPWQAVQLENTASGDAEIDVAFDCPEEGTYKVVVRVTPIDGTASTVSATFDVDLPGGPGLGSDESVLNVQKKATVESLGNGWYEATFGVEALHGGPGPSKGVVGLVVRFQADPAETYLHLEHDPDVQTRRGVHRCDVADLELTVDSEPIHVEMAEPTMRVPEDCVDAAKAQLEDAQATIGHRSKSGWTVHAAGAGGWTSDAVEYTATFTPEQGSAFSPYAMAFAPGGSVEEDPSDSSSSASEKDDGPIDEVSKQLPGPDGLDVIALVGVLAGIAISIGVVGAKLSGDDGSRRRPPRP